MLISSLTHQQVQPTKAALIVGSSPSAQVCSSWDTNHLTTIAINNAWRLRSDFNYSIYPPDFPVNRHAPRDGTIRHIQSEDYLESIADSGGRVFTGATMGFVAGYWAYMSLSPRVLAYVGCDMVYEPIDGKTHFYGTGSADPLRLNLSLRSLEAKSCRLFIKALLQGTLVVNISEEVHSRLVFPRASFTFLNQWQDYAPPLDRLLSPSELAAMQCTVASIERQECLAPFNTFFVGKVPLAPANLEFVDSIDQQWLKLLPHATQIEEMLCRGL